jgi:hypothetical protein
MNTDNQQQTEEGATQHAQFVNQAHQGKHAALAPYAAAPAFAGAGPVGKIRSTGTCMVLSVVTLGIYTLVWYYKTHEEMKRHTNTGVGGGIALLLSIFVGIVMPFITASEVGGLYERRGQRAPVSGATGLWMLFLGWFFFVGAIVWFVKVNGALNSYWRSAGAR